MKTIIKPLAFLVVFFCVYEAQSQSRWVEEWVAVGSAQPSLSEAWLEDAQKNKIEKRRFMADAQSREEWVQLVKTEYEGNNEIKAEMFSKEFENGIQAEMTILFDYEKNRMTKASVYSYDGVAENDPVMSTSYTYDTLSNLIKETTISLVDYYGIPSKPELISSIEYRYKDTLLLEEWKFSSDSIKFEHYRYTYDLQGNKVEKKLMDNINYLEKNLFTWKYDDSGKVIEDNTYFNNGTIFRKHSFFYNEAGDLIKQLEYGDNSKKPIVTVTYNYEFVDDK